MYARFATLGILAAIAATQTLTPAPTFTLQSTGAVRLHARGSDARYGVVPFALRGGPILMVSLGASRAAGAVQLSRPGAHLPAPGRYPIRSSWDEMGTDTVSFRASFMAGTAEQPLGWFHGESGWVTVTEADDGRIGGEFEVRARGFTSADIEEEGQWVTVQGSFVAAGDSTAARVTLSATNRP
jgi:hypothetical protein